MTATVRNRLLALGSLWGVLLAPAFGTLVNRAVKEGQ
jgi:hypothetical protein